MTSYVLTKTDVLEYVGRIVAQFRDLVDAQPGLTIDISHIMMLADKIEDAAFDDFGDKRQRMLKRDADDVMKRIRSVGIKGTAQSYGVSKLAVKRFCEKNNIDWERLEALHPNAPI